MLNIFMYYTPPQFRPVDLQHSSCKHLFSIRVENSVTLPTKPSDLDLQCFQKKDKPGLEVIKHFSCSTQLSTALILLINVKMPTIVGIFTFISMIITRSERPGARNFFICRYFSFYEHLKFHAQLS